MVTRRAVVGGVMSAMAFVVLAIALWIVNRRVPGPVEWSWAEVVDWTERRPVSASFRLASAIATVIAVYLAFGAAATACAAAARARGHVRAAAWADRAATPVLRRAMAGVVGLGLAVAADATTVLGAPPVVTETTTAPADRPAGSVATLRLLEATPETVAPAEPGPPEEEPGPPNEPVVTRTHPIEEPSWTIRPGDHLWGLAAAALRETGREPTEAETLTYVRAIVERNRDVLVVPDHPDLVLPGQVFARPPLP